MNDLFPASSIKKSDPQKSMRPLAVRMRPQAMDDIVGQEHLFSSESLLRKSVEAHAWRSLIFFGPAGSGKTTAARIISNYSQTFWVELQGAETGTSEIKKIIAEADRNLSAGKKTVLFIDELHRLNRAQQDVLLPAIENATILFIGTTTHNPSFSIIYPLLSRSLIFEFKSVTTAHIKNLLEKSLGDFEKGLGNLKADVADEVLETIAKSSEGDVRRAYNLLELSAKVSASEKKPLTVDRLLKISQLKAYDKAGDYHYDTISAFIKSMRASEVQVALYWLALMLESGEDPLFIIRRMLIFAAEDIGNADPQALVLTSALLHTLQMVGLPEGRIPLSQVVIYLSLAPKSKASYRAIEAALKDVRDNPGRKVPLELTNNPEKSNIQYSSKSNNPMDFPQYYHPSDKGWEGRWKAAQKIVKDRI